MSLIMDALKRAQQLKMKGPEGAPVLKYSPPDKGRRSFKRQWGLIAAGLISLSIISFILLRPAPSPFVTQTNHAIVLPQKSSVPVADKISQEPPREVVILPKDEEPLPTGQAANPAYGGTGSGQASKEVLLQAGVTSSGQPSHRQEEKASAENKLSVNDKKGGSQAKRAPQEEEIKPQKSIAEGKSLSAVTPASQKEESSQRFIGVEQDGEKDRTLTADVLIQFNLGVQFYSQRDFSKAIQAYQKVIELDPTYVEAYNNLGIIYQMIGDVDRAFGAYQKSTEINPRYDKGYNNLGILLFLKGRYEEALGSFQKALAVNPNNIETHINLGILFKKKGESEKAIESYQKALAISPFHKETHYNIALLYEQLENLELAISHYQQFIQLSSKSHPELVLQVKRHLYELTKTKK
jgi:type IV pilus biogenesis/stability protein PilW